MPKTILDYGKTIMYKIVCNDLNVNDCYVGHTTDMTKRKYTHKSMCNNEKDKYHNTKIYKIIRENGGWGNWSMILVEEFPCEDKYQACRREREVYEELDAKMNTRRPYRTQEELKEELKENSKQRYQEHKEEIKEYHKKYHEEHKEDKKQYYQEHKAEHKQNNKKYYQEHKAELNEKWKEKIECKYCAKLLSKGNMPRHHKTCKSKPVENDQNSIEKRV